MHLRRPLKSVPGLRVSSENAREDWSIRRVTITIGLSSCTNAMKEKNGLYNAHLGVYEVLRLGWLEDCRESGLWTQGRKK